MRKKTLPRYGADTGWSHPYGYGPFSPFLYADGGDGDGSGSGSGDGGNNGGSGDGGGGTGGDGEGAGGTGGQDTGKGDSAGKNGKQGAGKGDDSAGTIARLEKELADARKEAAKDRTTAKQQAADDARKALIEEVSKALGLSKDETEDTDPARLLTRLKESQTAITAAQGDAVSARVEATVLRLAYSNGVDGDRLLDSRSFCDEVDELDASDPKKFKADLKRLITEAAKKDQRLALSGSAGRSGGDQGGSGESNARKRPTSIGAAIKNTFNT